MKCEGCGKDFPIPQLQFVKAGMIRELNMKRREAKCKDCMKIKPIDRRVHDEGEWNFSWHDEERQ